MSQVKPTEANSFAIYLNLNVLSEANLLKPNLAMVFNTKKRFCHIKVHKNY